MKRKKCTESGCRREFAVKGVRGAVCCPYCGKKYPRIGPSTPQQSKAVDIEKKGLYARLAQLIKEREKQILDVK